MDNQGNIERVNPAFERALGRTEAEMLGQGLTRLVLVDDLAAFIKSFNWLPTAPPFRLLHKDSGVVVCKLIAARFRQGRGYLIFRRVI